MSHIDRRTLLYAMGAVSVTPLVFSMPEPRHPVVVKPNENRFPYANPQQAEQSPCKLTSTDTAGALSIFELNVLPKAGPVRHVHHREDEWCYVDSGEFVFEVGKEKYELASGGSIWMPREIPHVWANSSSAKGKLIVACQPGGFEKFFDELGKIPDAQLNELAIKQVMANYGMEYLGPPLFGLWRGQH
jgi:mannose-6-phosphate isomerase-like protein (cupin superfamily)